MDILQVGDKAIIEKDHFGPRDRGIVGTEVTVDGFLEWGNLVDVSWNQVVGGRHYPLSAYVRREGLRRLDQQIEEEK